MSIAVILSILFLVVSVAVTADLATKTEGRRPEGIGILGYIGYIVITLVLAVLMTHSIIACIAVCIAVGVLAVFNQEGRIRATSWSLLIVLDFIALIYAIARGWDKLARQGQFPKFGQLALLLFPIVVLIVNIINGHRLNKKITAEKTAEEIAKKVTEKVDAVKADAKDEPATTAMAAAASATS